VAAVAADQSLVAEELGFVTVLEPSLFGNRVIATFWEEGVRGILR